METDELKCNICFEQFGRSKKLPKMLTCGHTFCCNCLESVLSANKKCATCRKDISYNSTYEIPVNYAVKSLAEREVISYNICNEHRSEENWNCIDCQQTICGSCVLMYHKNCHTEYIDVIDVVKIVKRRKLMKEVETTKKFLTNYSKSLQTKSKELNEKLEKIKIDIVQNEKEQQNIENLQQELQIAVPDSAEQDISVDSLQTLLLEINSQIKQLKIIELTLEEPESLYTQLRIASPYEHQDILNSPQLNSEDVIVRLENGELIHAVETSDNESRFGLLELKNGTLRIHSFDTESPAQPCSTIPFLQLLSSLTESTELPGKVFFQFEGFEEELIVKTDEALGGTPRVLNFLYFSSGLKGPSYKDKIIGRDGSYAFISCPWKKNGIWVDDAVVDGISDEGDDEAPKKRGFVSGCRISRVNFCLKDWDRGRLEGKFGEIESGIQVLTQLRGGTLVQDCGFVITNLEVVEDGRDV